MSEHVVKRAFSALRWGYAGFAIRALTGFASGIILARLLGPKPFGQVAAVTLLFGLANQLADGGFSSALVQAPELDEAGIRFAFTCQLVIGATFTGACALLAPVIGAVLHDPIIQDVVRVTSLVFLIQAFGQSSAALLKRRLAFRALQTAQVTSSVMGYILIGIPAAACGAGVWSLVAAQITQTLTYAVMVFVQSGHSLIPGWSRSGSRLARFGVKVAGANILNWSISNFDNAFVARAFGSTALGLYSRAFNTVSTPTEAVVSTWQQVLFASCSRVGDRIDALKRAYLASISAVSLVTFPIFWTVAACAPTVVCALYGQRWAEAAPLLTPLALAITLHAVMAMAGPMLASADQVKREVKTQGLSLIVAVAAFSFSIRYTTVALAWAVLGVYMFRFIVATQPALRMLGLGWGEVIRVLKGPIATGVMTAGAAWTVAHAATIHSVGPGPALAALIFTGLAIVPILLILGADRILSKELVLVTMQLSGSLPSRVSSRLETIRKKQAARESQRQIRAPHQESLETTTP
jgi:lipopolysaccharide exporter